MKRVTKWEWDEVCYAIAIGLEVCIIVLSIILDLLHIHPFK